MSAAKNELDKVVEIVKDKSGEDGAEVVYFEENELGVVFAAVRGSDGTMFHVDAYGNVTSHEANPVTL